MGLFANLFGLQSDGDYGEEKILKDLNSFFLDGYRLFIQNAYVPMQRDKFTEVDLIMLHKSYIYVIESKYYEGWIYGSDGQKYWTQVFNKNSKHRFYSPVMQNQTHINALSKFLKIDKSKFMSYIVFSNLCKLKAIPSDTDNTKILQRDDLFGSIKQMFNSGVENFTNAEVDEIHKTLKPLTEVTAEVKKAHEERLKASYKK